MRYRLECVCGGKLKFGAEAAEAQVMVDRFNSNHSGCSPVSDKWRCGACGILLLHKDRCPVHAGSVRLLWTPQLAAAYESVIRAIASGVRPVVPLAEGLVYAQAVEAAKKWGWRARRDRVRGEVAS